MRALSRTPYARKAIAALGLATMLVAYSAAAAEKEFDKKFAATPGGTLRVETDFGGIVVSGADTTEVMIHATLSGTESQLRDFDISAASDGRGVTVRGKRYNNWWLDLTWLFGGDLRAKFTIQVPRDYHVEVRTSGGAIESQNINGNVYGRTSGGRVMLNSINGTVDAYTSGGRIEARQLVGNVLLRTSGGGITVADAKGDLDVRTSGGGIRLQGVEGRIEARTSGGSIEANIRGANRGVQLRTAGGGIRVEVPKDFKARLDAHTSGGSVYCDLPVTSSDVRNDGERESSRESTREKRREHDREDYRDREDRRDDENYRDRDKKTVYGDVNGGGAEFVTRTSGGSIRIRAN